MDSEMKEEEEEVSVMRAAELVHALISSIYCVRFFPVKWRLIREKLEQLQSGLSAAADGVDSGKSPELGKILHSLVSALRDGQALADKCSDESYRGGKLLLKSDVEITASKIELQLRNLSEANASRALSHSQAIILSKPEAGASREDMKFYLNDLVARLKISDSLMRIRTLCALNDVLREDEKYVRIMAAETSDGLHLLVKLLELGEAGVQEEAAEAMSAVSAVDSCKAALVAAGALAPLIRVLEKGSEVAKLRAARALMKLTENSENSWSVSAQGGVSALLKICGNADSGGELTQSACGILRSLSGVDEIRRFMVEKGAVSVFVKLSRSTKEESSKIQALELLTILASDEDIKDSMAKEDVVESLVGVLDPSSPHSCKAREVALRAIETLCFSSPSSMNVLMSSAFLHRVLFFLRNGETSVQESALKAVSRLCGQSEASKSAMGDTGFMPELLRLLEAKSFHVREMAAEALCGMISVPRNKSRFIQEDQNVNRILQLLNPEEEKSVTKKFLLSAVASLTDSKSVRRKIVASGCIKYLEKLAETDVTDAKKIVKKLSGNRFLSIFTGIWSS